jgi:hypothetical protein
MWRFRRAEFRILTDLLHHSRVRKYDQFQHYPRQNSRNLCDLFSPEVVDPSPEGDLNHIRKVSM